MLQIYRMVIHHFRDLTAAVNQTGVCAVPRCRFTRYSLVDREGSFNVVNSATDVSAYVVQMLSGLMDVSLSSDIIISGGLQLLDSSLSLAIQVFCHFENCIRMLLFRAVCSRICGNRRVNIQTIHINLSTKA